MVKKSKKVKEIPELQCRVNFFLIKKLSPRFNLKRFQENLKSFERELEKQGNKILREIGKILKEEWKEKDITIYPIPPEAKIPSMSSPLLLKIRSNQSFNLYVLTHELIHRFVEKSNLKIDKKPGIELEAFVVFVTQKVFSKIFGAKLARKMRRIEKRIVMSRDEKMCEEIIKRKKKFWEELIG